MENLIIEGTSESPTIKFNAGSKILHIEGESYMENPPEFYKPVFDWLEKFINIYDERPIDFNLKLDYFNTSSIKIFMMIFEILVRANKLGQDITINWYYNPENEIDLEYAEYFKDEVKLPFNIIRIN